MTESKTEQPDGFVERCLARPERLGYLAWHEQAAQLVNRGIRQAQCRHCLRWRFPDEHMPGERCEHFATSGPEKKRGNR